MMSTMSDSPTETLVSTITALGGPSISASALDWVGDIPSGESLLEWLAAQGLDVSVKDLSDEEKDEQCRAATGRVALEQDEVDL